MAAVAFASFDEERQPRTKHAVRVLVHHVKFQFIGDRDEPVFGYARIRH
jgi:hypothetical protein